MNSELVTVALVLACIGLATWRLTYGRRDWPKVSKVGRLRPNWKAHRMRFGIFEVAPPPKRRDRD